MIKITWRNVDTGESGTEQPTSTICIDDVSQGESDWEQSITISYSTYERVD